MDTEAFIFPFYFKYFVNIYFYLFLCPFRFVKRGKARANTVRSYWFQKVICFGLQGPTLLFGLVVISSFVFINLKRYPTQLFRITKESLNLATTITVLYTVWFKRKELHAIAEIPKGKIKRSNQVICFIFFIVFPMLTPSFEAANFVKSLLDPSTRDRMAYTFLEAIYIKPQTEKPTLKQMKLKTWERITGLSLFIVTRFAFVISSFRPVIVLFQGFALAEINSRLSEVVDKIRIKGNCKGLLKVIKQFKTDYLSKVQSVIKPVTTVHVVAAYATLSKDLVILAEYPWQHLCHSVVVIIVITTVLVKNAQATAVARKTQKKILLCDDREISSANLFKAADVGPITDMGEFGASGLISMIDFGSLGLAFGVTFQLAIMMLQFMVEEKKSIA